METVKTHKNKANVDCVYFIGLLYDNNEVRFVTDVNYLNKSARWEKGKEPKSFCKVDADDIVFGLLMNFYPAFVVEMPSFLSIKNNLEY